MTPVIGVPLMPAMKVLVWGTFSHANADGVGLAIDAIVAKIDIIARRKVLAGSKAQCNVRIAEVELNSTH